MNRDRRLVMIAVLAVLLLFAAINWIVLPIGDYRHELAAEAAETARELGDLQRLVRHHEQLVSQAGAVRKGAVRAQTLFSLLENTATRLELRRNIEFMRPSERTAEGGASDEVVEMRLAGVPLDKLVAYLEAVAAAGQGVRVDRLNMRSNEKRPLDVDLVFAVLGRGRS